MYLTLSVLVVHVPYAIIRSTHIEILDFNKSNLPKLTQSLDTIDCPNRFCGTSVNVYLDVAII